MTQTIHEVASALLKVDSTPLTWEEYDLLTKLQQLVARHSMREREREKEAA